jgi:hypothetical protein
MFSRLICSVVSVGRLGVVQNLQEEVRKKKKESTIGATISASHLNNEFQLLLDAPQLKLSHISNAP